MAACRWGQRTRLAALLCRFSSSSPPPLRNASIYGIVSCLLILLRLALAGRTSCPRLPRSAGCGAFGCLGRLRSRIYSFEDLIEFLFCALSKAAAVLSEEEERREGGRRRGAFLFSDFSPYPIAGKSIFSMKFLTNRLREPSGRINRHVPVPDDLIKDAAAMCLHSLNRASRFIEPATLPAREVVLLVYRHASCF